MAHLTYEQADKVFNILIQYGMKKDLRRDFILYVSRSTPGDKEYRFMGEFGRGGKVTVSNMGVRVGYFSKDCTPERLARCIEANELLREFEPIPGFLSSVTSARVDKR